MELKIGILLPRSEMFPTLALDFLNALKLAISELGNDAFYPKFVIESIGNATGSSVLETIEKIVLQEDPDLTITFCSIFQLKALTNIFNAYKKPLIHIDLGGNILKKEHIDPYVIHHTLNLWQSSYLSGVYAASTLGKNAACLSSFYDGGYHLNECFVRGLMDNAGSIVYSYVSPMDYKSESFETMIQTLEKVNPDFIFTLFSYKEGNKIFEVISQSKLIGKIPLFASPLMTDENSSSGFYNIDNVYSLASWAFDEATSQMNDFQTNYSNVYGNAPNLISLLGYEVGLTISNCIEKYGNVPAKISECVNSLVVDSPRGKLTFNGFNESQVPLNKVRQFLFNENRNENKVIKYLETSVFDELYEKFQDLPYSGWQNPYIIT